MLCVTLLYAFIFSSTPRAVSAGYSIAANYQGEDFFSGFDYYGFYDNLTWGNVNYLEKETAASQRLTYLTSSGTAMIKVDNSSRVSNTTRTTDTTIESNRNSIRLTSQLFYPIGSLFIFDAKHIPYGCGVWPAVWTTEQNTWPNGGEIDIIEAINLMTHNNMAIHTTPGCTAITNQTPQNQRSDCSSGSGCVQWETKPNSYGSGFASNGGGVFAMQFDTVGIFIWFFPRTALPNSISGATGSTGIDIKDWGMPSAAYLTSDQCDIPNKFSAQQIVINIALCGVWAGIPSIYNATCSHTPTASCIADNVWGPPSNLDNAFFEFNYIRTYTLDGVQPFYNTSDPNFANMTWSPPGGGTVATPSNSSFNNGPATSATSSSSSSTLPTTTTYNPFQVPTSYPSNALSTIRRPRWIWLTMAPLLIILAIP